MKVVDVNKITMASKLRVSDLVQVDGTVIVGVLILLTLGSASLAGGGKTIVGIITASIVYPFALSAIRTTIKGSVEYGLKLTISGFVYLMVAVIVVSFIQ